MSSDFYRELVPFSVFRELSTDAYYRPLPEDWLIFIADVKGSTKAIEAGRYKDVNQVGAAAIACVQNVLSETAFPYVFGGDGASLAVGPENAAAVRRALGALKLLSQETFGLELRAGMVPVRKLYEMGSKVEVAKHELFFGKSIAIFRGGGLSLAEKLVKVPASEYELPVEREYEANLKNLSCRWNPIPNVRGTILCLLVLSREANESASYLRIVSELERVLQRPIDAANPVNPQRMSYKGVVQCLQEEGRFAKGWLHVHMFLRFLEIVAAVLVFKRGLSPIIFDAAHYRLAMRSHADHRKFDDMLRMVIDCSQGEVQALKEFLHGEYLQGNIYYGIHLAEEALMTCFVQDVSDGNHIHFIDGGDGGYAVAASQLKAQMQG